MISLPPLRRLLVPSLICLALIIFYRSHFTAPPKIQTFVFRHPAPPPPGIRVPLATLDHLSIHNASQNHLSPPQHLYYTYPHSVNLGKNITGSGHIIPTYSQPLLNPYLGPLFKCPIQANRFTGHIRLPNPVRNISMIPPGSTHDDRRFWNPTIMSLPWWSENQYLLVSRIVTDGNYQENVLCEANICYTNSSMEVRRKGDEGCTPDDLQHLGGNAGLRCVGSPVKLGVPPTPAEKCLGKFESYTDIPGFHDPRIFWSGRGEPLMIVNTQSRYACFGLWIIDLRVPYPPLHALLASSPTHPSLGPLISYPQLTELTRNPPSTRSPMEKNWMFFAPDAASSYVHYELSPHTRTFAKLLGDGLTTPNLTDPLEQPCLQLAPEGTTDGEGRAVKGTWHQSSNSLKLILCDRAEAEAEGQTEKGKERCVPNADNAVFVAVVHRKHDNGLGLPLRYERYLVLWSAYPPFALLAVSKHPLLFANETAGGWSAAQNWDDVDENDDGDGDGDDREGAAYATAPAAAANTSNATAASPTAASPPGIGVKRDAPQTQGKPKNAKDKSNWAYFTYTVSIAYARRPAPSPLTARAVSEDLNTGYLDDEVVVGIGIMDGRQTYARVRVKELLGCLRACQGRRLGDGA
ncbi:hypothetical protein LTR16_003412 [Cryomyces antarcticus]|uniref:Phytase-like domain-containing protein n=1 Tax=Cryomyces antarcticus TaxID=329879 RepID=A0ABR0M6W9_9PEZI|nr:hypothetical protein LTR16_003412 [Cryomyces antarcticus]